MNNRLWVRIKLRIMTVKKAWSYMIERIIIALKELF